MNDRPTLVELTAFAAIARHGSFRAAADELGLSPSTLSHMMRALEERLDLRLFNRTTRSVAPTEAGTRLLRGIGPVLTGLDEALAELRDLHDRPSGTVRINATTRGAEILMQRAVPAFAALHPAVQLDLVTEGRWADIVAEGFDAGVRLLEAVPQDMIAVPFGGDERFVVVATPAYLAARGTPTAPADLMHHACIRFRLSSGRTYRWEFERRGEEQKMEVPGTLVLDDMRLVVGAVRAGLGIGFVHIDLVRDALESGALNLLLDEWTPPFPGYCLYYPSRRLLPSGLRAFIDVLRDTERAAAP
ncbi:MAG: LysR family transcriptional regulator [Pirellulales bacterium]